jgi:hypothetical protein
MGNHNAGGIGFKGPDQIAVAALGYPGQHIHIVDLGSADSLLDGGEVIGNMLHAGPYAVKTTHGCQFHISGICKIDFDAGRYLTVSHLPQNTALSHFHKYVSFFIGFYGFAYMEIVSPQNTQVNSFQGLLRKNPSVSQ